MSCRGRDFYSHHRQSAVAKPTRVARPRTGCAHPAARYTHL